VARKFVVTVLKMEAVEREGLGGDWPPGPDPVEVGFVPASEMWPSPDLAATRRR
jgi:hypothetical protein